MIRPGQAKGPSVAPGTMGGGTILVPTTVPTWFAPIEFDFTQFNGTAALIKSNTLATLLARGTIEGMVVKTKTAWVGAGITSLLFSIGINANLAKYLSSYSGLAAVSSTNFATADQFRLEDFTATTPILVSVVAQGANLTALTAGVCSVYIKGALLTAP